MTAEKRDAQVEVGFRKWLGVQGRSSVHIEVRMIRCSVRRLRSLPILHYGSIFTTIIFPPIIPPVLSLFCITMGPVWLLVGYSFWSLIVVLVIASLVYHDRSKMEQDVDRKLINLFTNLTGKVQLLKDEISQTTRGGQDRVTEIESVMRSVFEELGLRLPPRQVSGQATISSGMPQISATGTATRPHLGLRFGRWVKRHSRHFWRWFYG